MRGYYPPADRGAPPWRRAATSPTPALPPADWASQAFLALDFETTGLDASRDRVVEIGALRFGASPAGDRREEGAFASLVNPGMPIPSAARSIHGISDGEVAGAPSFPEIAPCLLAFFEGATLLAHNAPFDLGFLHAELARAGLASPGNPVLDTRDLARAAWPGRRSYRLSDLAADLGLHSGSAHRALDDARTCSALFLLCAARLRPAHGPC